jgi:hypothetical protein
MAEILHVLGEVAEEENVIFTNLASDLDLLGLALCKDLVQSDAMGALRLHRRKCQ